ncbi:unnamed protein product [Heligmosomoides polygyrus]|uniref:MSP domain-containing protein n=1 Tax=Heligmosomoides polygyrus TaxID=6339 RepID=A0A3P7Y3M1_HELPZ|nr:unnamed protein product [Heligmosomoides polygyrus]
MRATSSTVNGSATFASPTILFSSLPARAEVEEMLNELNVAVPPGDISTQPNSKIVFNAPYDDKHTYHIKIINASGRRIG